MFKFAIAAALLASAGTASAANFIFFGENQNPGNAVVGDPLTARNAFFAALTAGVSTEDFEGFASGTVPASITFNGSAGNIVATFGAGTGSVQTGPNGVGRFATSPTQYFETTDAFNVTFSTPVAAFGFYGTDIGDFNGQLSVVLTRGGVDESLVVPHTVGGNDGSLLFWGVLSTNPFDSVRFSQSASGTDFLGFDDLVIGDRNQVVIPAIPEPATWGMMIAGFGLVGFAMRRRETMARVAA
jgi:hypothetical protein